MTKHKVTKHKVKVRAPIIGVNDLKTTHPLIAKKWHPTKNGSRKPTDISRGATIECWWRHYDRSDRKWHEWSASPNTMTNPTIDYHCSVCSNHQIQVGINDMATTHPILAKMWHPTKNGDLTPRDVFGCTSHTHWWYHIDKDSGLLHEWPQTGNKMTRKDVLNPYGCLICSKIIIIAGINDLATTHSELALKWHPTKNGSLLPTQVASGANIVVWWYHLDSKTGLLHEWDVSPARMMRDDMGYKCPICDGKRIMIGVNDLASQNSRLAKQWHPTKNGPLTPKMVSEGSARIVWWRHYDRISKRWHKWPATVAGRSTGRGCPRCKRRGFRLDKPGSLYLIQGDVKGYRAIQFGISQDLKNRLRQHKNSGFTETLAIIDFPVGSDAMALERSLIHLMRDHHIESCFSKGIRFDGSTEAFCLEDAEEEFLEEFKELLCLPA